MDFPISLDHSLAFAPTELPFVVGHIALAGIADYCDRLGLHEGDEVRCRLSAPEHVVLTRRNDGEIILPRRFALFVEVAPVPQPA